MSRHVASWWAKRVDELSRGEDAESIARRHGVKARTLVWWRSELVRRARKKPTSAPGPRRLPVVVDRSRRAMVSVRDDVLDVVVELDTARVVLRGALSPEHLAALVAAARSC